MPPTVWKHLAAAAVALALAACDAAPERDVASDAPPPAAEPGAPGNGDAAGDVADDAYAPRWDGIGPATFGMTADEVRAAWEGDLGDNPVEAAACFHLAPTEQPGDAHFAMMFGDGRFVRYSAANDAMTAPGGGRRGMSDGEIEALYPGRVERQPHKYTDGQYLRVGSEGDSVLVFETDEAGAVTEWRVGVPPYVDYVEGCS